MKWYDITVDTKTNLVVGGEIPKLYKELLLQIKSTQPGIPDHLSVGYLKPCAGDYSSLKFIIPGAAGEVVRWCDCFDGKKFVWPEIQNQMNAKV